MSNVKVEDLSPTPFFARFLEGQSVAAMSPDEMKAVCGGGIVTMAAPSDQEGVPGGVLSESYRDMILRALEGPGIPPLPGPYFPQGPTMVTMAYPSDNEGAAEVPFG